MLLDSIHNGPFQFKEITILATETTTSITRMQQLSDLTPEEMTRHSCDIKATNIILLGLPSDIYTLINHHKIARDIWSRVKELMEGTELTKQERESKLYDEFIVETIQSYYLRFAKLINDMNIIGMSMKTLQINTKFVNHLQLEWSRFVTAAKQAKSLHEVSYDQLYAYLKQNENDANEVQLMRKRFPYPLALIANTYNPPPSYSRKGKATGTGTINIVKDLKAYPPRVISCYNYKSEGHIAKQCTAKKMVKDSEWFNKKMILAQAQEARGILHEEQQELLAKGLKDLDLDSPMASSIFMERLSPTGLVNGDDVGPSYDSDILIMRQICLILLFKR
ncbi:hypothetical protein Tco_1460406 [Tanacetum coccineum]